MPSSDVNMANNQETVPLQSSRGGMLRQFLLVELAISLEAAVTLEVVLMIANIQTLGVPIRYASVPGMVSAATGMFLIPTAGFIMDRRSKTKSGKAKILFFTASLQIIGILLVLLANTIKLMYFDKHAENAMLILPVVSPHTDHASLTSTRAAHITQVLNRNDSKFSVSQAHEAASESNHHMDFLHAPTNSIADSQHVGENIRFFAIMAMVGYSLIDCGYTSSCCFLKTFVLAVSEPKDHAGIIVKSILVASFGGCFIAVLESLRLGDYLTADTGHDSNAAQCALMAALCFVLDLIGLSTTLTTGFCCPPNGGADVKQDDDAIITTSLTTSEKSEIQSTHRHTDSDWPVAALNGTDLSPGSPVPHKSAVADQAVVTPTHRIRGFLMRQKKQILINITTFFLLGSLYSFEVFAVNFVSVDIFGGDPSADVDSKEYQKYLDGIQFGSMGSLTYYISFTVVNIFQEFLLDKLGWKTEILLSSGIQVAANLLCALTATLWSFFLAAVMTGISRTVSMSVPYILANKFATEQGGGNNSGLAIAMVAAMLPLGFTVCSAIMGPLIDVTGNSATPIYYTAVTAFLGAVTICFLKDK